MAKKRTKAQNRAQGKANRRKGHDFERWLARELKELYPDAKRNLEYQKDQANGRDLANTGGFLFQCKRGRLYAPITAIEEIQVDPIDGGVPVLVTKGDGKEPMAVLSFTAFKRLVRKATK